MPSDRPIHICGDGEGFRITVRDPDAVFTARSISIRPAPLHPGRLLQMSEASLVSGDVDFFAAKIHPDIVYYVPAYGEAPSETLKHYVMRNI